MLDAVDTVIKKHLQSILSSVNGRKISVFSVGTADQEDQPFNQAAQEAGKSADKVELPFVSLIRLPNIEITDDHMTKRVHTYDGYGLDIPGASGKLTYYRCTLHYVATVFAENRKLSEDLITSLYGRLRNYCQVQVLIRLPVQVDDGPNGEKRYAAAPMDVDIELGNSIEQTNPITSEKAQLYKAKIAFDVKNVNIYHIAEERNYKYNVFVEPKLDGENGLKGHREQVFPPDESNEE